MKVTVGDIQLTEEDKKLINSVLDSNRLSYGPIAKKFESEFAKIHDSKFSLFTNSGTSCLHIAIAALKEIYGWKDGSEIIIPSITFVATVNAVLHNNLKPVLVDVNFKTYNIDVTKIEEKITPNTVCIIPVHLLGLPCDMGPIMDIAKKYNLRIIEDSCETMFAKYKGRSVGSFGDIGAFSTYIAHYIVTGVGGLCTTSDHKIATILRSLMNHGRDGIYISIDDDEEFSREVVSKRFRFERIGHSFRATEIEAALGYSQLQRWEEIFLSRTGIAAKYTSKLQKLEDLGLIQLPYIPDNTEHAFMLYGIVVIPEDKWGLINYLEERGIETREMLPLTNQPCYNFNEDDYPVAKWLNNSAFYIGCHQYITDEQINYVVKTFYDYFGESQ